jgi:hypothetical protein
MITSEQRMERLILALCDELMWGLRSFFAYEELHKSELRLTPTLFDTFYWACLDQSALILSRIVVAKHKFKDDSVNVQYLLEQARNNPTLFHYSGHGDIETLVKQHFELLDSYKSLIDILEDQRDRNLTHLDIKHIRQPEWRENQTQLDLDRFVLLYRDLVSVMQTYYQLFFGEKFDFGEWQITSKEEVELLIAFYEAYQSKAL